MVCGVALSWRRYLYSSARGSSPSTEAVCNNLHKNFTKFSVKPLHCGSSGLTGESLNPISFAYSAISWLEYGGPLSVVSDSGMPWVEKILSNMDFSFLRIVEDTRSTSGNLEYWSRTACRWYFPLMGPLKSACTFYQGRSGRKLGCRGTGCVCG